MGRSRRNERREMSREALMLRSSIMNTEGEMEESGPLSEFLPHLEGALKKGDQNFA